MNLKDSQGNILIPPEDIQKLHDGIKILLPLKTKYYKLGRIVSSLDIPSEIKNQFFSFGREMSKLIDLWDCFGETDHQKR